MNFKLRGFPKNVVPRSNLYDVFVAIRDDELEHVKTMIACQQPDAQQTFQSPHTAIGQLCLNQLRLLLTSILLT